MSVTLDRPTGRLRISAPALSALLALAQGADPTSLHEEDVAALRTAGVLGQDGIDDDVRAVLAGLARAGVHIELAVTRPSGYEMHRVWAATDTATLAAQVGEDAYDVLALPPSLVVPALARLMPLEPRPLLPGDVVDVPDDTVVALVGPERAFAANTLLGAATTAWNAVADDVRAGRVRVHGLVALWVDQAGEPAGRRFSVLDTPSGLAEVVALEDGRPGLRPVRSTEVWSMLVELLPADDEVAPDSDVSPVVTAPSVSSNESGGWRMNIDEVVGPESWTQFEATLTGHLSGLHRHGFVTIDPPQRSRDLPPEDPPRRGLLGRLSRRRIVPRNRPFVQLSRDDLYVDAETSGPVGDVPVDTAYAWNADQQHRLRELGWQKPDELGDWQMYRWYGWFESAPVDSPSGSRRRTDDGAAVPPATAADAARLVVSTLRDVYGLSSPTGLTLIVDRLPN